MKLAAAQFDLETAIAELSRTGASTTLADTQLGNLAQLQRQLGTASATTIAKLRGEIGAAVSQAHAVIQQSRNAATISDDAEHTVAGRQMIADVANDYYERKLLDPYLRFASGDDEAEYRKRERDNREAIEHELAKGTPEGDHRAAQIMDRQLDDAEAHGAGACPDFAAMREKNANALRMTSEAVHNQLPSPEPRGQVATSPASSPDELDGVLAALQAAGVTKLQPAESEPHHGTGDAARFAALTRSDGRG